MSQRNKKTKPLPLKGVFFSLFTYTLLSAEAFAQATPPIESGNYILTVIFSLIAVLILIFGAAIILKKLTQSKGIANGLLKVVGGVSLGNRERLVIVEINDEKILLGVTSNEITLIKEITEKTESQLTGQ